MAVLVRPLRCTRLPFPGNKPALFLDTKIILLRIRTVLIIVAISCSSIMIIITITTDTEPLHHLLRLVTRTTTLGKPLLPQQHQRKHHHLDILPRRLHTGLLNQTGPVAPLRHILQQPLPLHLLAAETTGLHRLRDKQQPGSC